MHSSVGTIQLTTKMHEKTAGSGTAGFRVLSITMEPSRGHTMNHAKLPTTCNRKDELMNHRCKWSQAMRKAGRAARGLRFPAKEKKRGTGERSTGRCCLGARKQVSKAGLLQSGCFSVCLDPPHGMGRQ